MNTESQTDRITQLEAACAAMREFLITIRQQVFPGLDLPAKYTVWMHEALSPDAGKSLLEKYQYHLADNQRLKGELERVCDRLQAVEAENKSRRKEIASLDEQLIEAKRAIETQYNLRQAVEKERDRYKAVLEFYADPNTYFAMVIFPDPPCGEFVDDFSDVEDWGTRPGKRAREALQPAQKEQ